MCEAFDWCRFCQTAADRLTFSAWAGSVAPSVPPHSTLPPDGFYVFVSADAAARYAEWVSLMSEVAIYPVVRVELPPADYRIAWTDGVQAYVFAV